MEAVPIDLKDQIGEKYLVVRAMFNFSAKSSLATGRAS
jgi:hypothetical protein